MMSEKELKRLIQVSVASKDGTTFEVMSQESAEKLQSKGKIVEENVRDWVLGEDGKAHDTIVGTRLRRR